jgi:hypothetical protein
MYRFPVVKDSTTQRKAITARLYQDGDEHKIVRLFEKVFDRKMTIGEWRWKYLGGEKGRVYSSLAIDDGSGEAIAHYGGVMHRMVFRGKEMYGLAIGDVMVHPGFRGLRLFKRVASLLPQVSSEDGIRMGYGFPNDRAMLLPEKLGLYERIEELREAVKEAEFHRGPFRYLYKLFPLDYSDERIDDLWEASGGWHTLSVIRDRRYLVWRYKNHPLFTYELWGLKRRAGRSLKGLAVLRKNNEEVMIMDYVCKKEDMRILFEKLENAVSASGGKRLRLWAPPFLADDFGRLGFSVRNAAIWIPRTTHEAFLKKHEIAGNFFYTMGDTDFL